MPFTLAHPIAVWPLWQLTQKRLDLPALMVGAMMPDISYFIALHPVPNIGHSLAGIVLEGIPAGLLLLLVGRYLLWYPVVALLPSKVGDRIPPASFYSFWSWPRLFNIALSLFVGALTHVGWDSFTHASGWGVVRIGWLSSDFFNLPVYKWLQYGGGVVGLLLLGSLAISALRSSPSRYQHYGLSTMGCVIACWIIAVIASLVMVQALVTVTVLEGVKDLMVQLSVGSVSGLFAGLCLYSILFWLTSRWRLKKNS